MMRRQNRWFGNSAIGVYHLQWAFGIVVLASLYAAGWACDGCNIAYKQQLRRGVGSNTLGNKELLLVSETGSAQRLLLAKREETSAPAAIAALTAKPVEFVEIIKRDLRLPIPPTSYVPQNLRPDKRVQIELSEGEVYLGKGVIYRGFTTNNSVPGPTLIVDEGDIVEFTVKNSGNIPHGVSIHATYSQTSRYLGKILPGETRSFLFRATYPGVYMYHCAPGGHAIPMHVMFGQYGMMVVKPKKKYRLEQLLGKKPDVELYILQHEIYASGKDAIEGKPLYVMFNGRLFGYVEEPIKAKPGDYVRVYYLNVGPNRVSTFHLVGIVWDFAYWQGHPDNVLVGGQTVTAGPSDSWVIEFRVPPDEGSYLIVDHAMGNAARGAIGILQADRNARTPVTVLAEGPSYPEAQMKTIRQQAARIVAPFEPGSPDVDVPVVVPPHEKEVIVQIIGNSFYPKVLEVSPGTTIKWINEDVFTYMEGEFAGVHNVVVTEGPENFASPLLGHAESWSKTITEPGEYAYMCAPHPYMKGKIIVRNEPQPIAATPSRTLWWTLGIALASGVLAVIVWTAGRLKRVRS
jgi:nitrite reductase (NO-forming)